ncbi:MAG: hypothetical protein AAF671_11945 [Pseudomonadota bacterium]
MDERLEERLDEELDEWPDGRLDKRKSYVRWSGVHVPAGSMNFFVERLLGAIRSARRGGAWMVGAANIDAVIKRNENIANPLFPRSAPTITRHWPLRQPEI